MLSSNVAQEPTDSEMIPVAPVVTGITFTFTFHTPCPSMQCFRTYSASFLITFLSPEITPSITTRAPSVLSRIMLLGLLLRMAQSVCTCRFYSMVTLPSRLFATIFGP
jgi:hypothetical protein